MSAWVDLEARVVDHAMVSRQAPQDPAAVHHAALTITLLTEVPFEADKPAIRRLANHFKSADQLGLVP